MLAKIQKWGNSQGLRLSRQLLDCVDVQVGDEVEVIEKEGLIVISPLKRVRGRQNLNALLKHMPKEYHAEEINWGLQQGREEW